MRQDVYMWTQQMMNVDFRGRSGELLPLLMRRAGR